MHQRAARGGRDDRGTVLRWECRCKEPPVLLGTYEPAGPVNIKVRDRYWRVVGRVWTICPRCGTEHTLEPQPAILATPEPVPVPTAGAGS